MHIMKSMRSVACAMITGAMIVAGGCASPDFTPREQAVNIIPPVNAEMENRAVEFRSVMAENHANGVFINDETMNFFAGIPEILAERIATLGISEAYICYNTDFFANGTYQEALAQLLAELKKRNISAKVAFKMSDTVWKRSDNFFVRNISNPKHDMLGEITGRIKDFNRKYEENPFSGVVFDMNVEAFSGHNLAVPGGQIYSWSANNYGIGRDNDMLIRSGFAMLGEIKNSLPGMTTGCLFSSNLSRAAEAGELSIGKVSDFAAAADTIFIRVNAAASADIVRAASAIFPQGGEKQISLYLELAVHAENDRPALRRRSFRQFITGMNAVNNGCSDYSQFRGLAFDGFAGLEDIWEK